ncbi:MAG TPA: hypothetical protein VLV17_05880 [Anaeromyxobacteraceae bacterium]|nr:hypothetical protein [Anaeromyxobacteraceae bacterium]
MSTNVEERLAEALATAVLGIDTLWGGDVLSRSGTGRFIADSWFSDRPLPKAYLHPAAAAVRAAGGVASEARDRRVIDTYLEVVDIAGALAELRSAGSSLGGERARYLEGLVEALLVMWELALERMGRGSSPSYERCVLASTGHPPSRPRPEPRRERLSEILARVGYPSSTPEELGRAVEGWRSERRVPMKALRLLAQAFSARFEAGARRHLVPRLPPSLRGVPLANVEFEMIADAWFSGSMNYLGRARGADGKPLYEATYEVNASLEISIPELAQLVSHEVVPGHVTTFALLQAQHVAGALGFEATLLTMCTRASTLFEGIANNALLLAEGVREVSELADLDLQIGTLLALLQDDAKSESSYLAWQEGWPREEVAEILRRDFLCSRERADKLSGAWGRHPLLGRMYLPAYRAGTEKVAELLRRHPPEKLFPLLFGAAGPVDIVTIETALEQG